MNSDRQTSTHLSLFSSSTLSLQLTLMILSFSLLFSWSSPRHSCSRPVIEAVTPEIVRPRRGTTKCMEVASCSSRTMTLTVHISLYSCDDSVCPQKCPFTYLFSVVHVLQQILRKCPPPQPSTHNLQGKCTAASPSVRVSIAVTLSRRQVLLLPSEFGRGKQKNKRVST